MVVKGHKVGIFKEDWSIVQTYVSGYSGAIYKGFKSLDLAETYFKETSEALNIPSDSPIAFEKPLVTKSPVPEKKKTGNKILRKEDFPWDEDSFDYSGTVMFTDGSVLFGVGNKSVLGTSFGLVVLEEGEVVCLDARAYNDSHNRYKNISGEVRGVLSALDYADRNNIKKIKICFDYIGVALWLQDFGGAYRWKASSDIAKAYVKTVEEKYAHINIEFVKVPAHENVKYNELADNLAKGALQGDDYLRRKRVDYSII